MPSFLQAVAEHVAALVFETSENGQSMLREARSEACVPTRYDILIDYVESARFDAMFGCCNQR